MPRGRESWRIKPKRPRGYYRAQARAIYDLEMREAIMRFTREGLSDDEIASRLGQSVPTIQQYRRRSLGMQAPSRHIKPIRGLLMVKTTPSGSGQRGGSPTRALPLPPGRDGAGATSGRRGERSASGSKPPPSASGETMDSPEIIQLRRDCLRLRKAMMPFDMMAHILGVTENEARKHFAEAINELQVSEQMNVDMHRQLMIEQIDQMIAAIHAPSTGYDILGRRVDVVYDAIDRMLKLMKQKADLLGLSTQTAVDLRVRLQGLAEEGGYDIVDLEEIARQVLQAHKLKLPEFR